MIKINGTQNSKVKALFAFLIIWLPAPPLQGNTVCRLLCVVVLLWLLWKKAKNGTVPIYVLTGLVLIGVMLTVGFAVGDNINQHMALYLVLLYTLCTAYLCDLGEDIESYEFLIPLTFIAMTVWNIFTIKALIANPHIMRYLVKNNSGYGGFGVGGYGHAYGSVLLIPLALDYTLKEQNKKNKIIAAAYLTTTVYMILNSGYLLSVLAMVLGFAYYLIMRRTDKNNIGWFLLVFVLLLVLYIKMEDILLYLINRLDVGGMRMKLVEIYELLSEEGAAADLEKSSVFGTRYERYTRDLALIWDSPIWGVLTHMKVGKHSTLLDTFAQFGIPVGCLFCYTLVKPLRQSLGNSLMYSRMVGATIAELFFVLLFNNIAMGMGILYILIPVYCLSHKVKKEI